MRGIAKDPTTTASKALIELAASTASGQLVEWVAGFAGSRNAIQGAGFFLGGPPPDKLGFQVSPWTMSGLPNQSGGLLCSLSGSAAMLIVCGLIMFALPDGSAAFTTNVLKTALAQDSNRRLRHAAASTHSTSSSTDQAR